MKKLFLGALLAPVAAFAADPVVLEPVVVTATGHPVPESRTLAAVTVIDRDEILRSQATDIAELLRFVAGVDLGRTGGPGQSTTVFVRGGESNHTLVLVDGVRVNPGTSGGAALQHIPPEMIERIELVKGPRSTLYGSDAIAGVINVITRKGAGADVQIKRGSHDTRSVSARLGHGGTAAQWSVFAEQLDADGFPTCRNSQEDRGYTRDTVKASAGLTLGAAELSASGWHTDGVNEYLSFCGPGGLQPRAQRFNNEVYEVQLALRPSEQWESRLSVSRMKDRSEQISDQQGHVETLRPRLHWLNSVQATSALRLSVGLEAAREDVDFLSFGSKVAEERDITSQVIQAELDAQRHRVVAALGHADYEGFGNKLTGTLEYGFLLRSETQLIASMGTGFRAPDATDRFGFGGDPNLRPEESRTLELGLRQQFGPRHQLDLRLFRNDVDDLIAVQFDPSNDPAVDFGFRAVNVDEYRNRGAELSYQWRKAEWTARLTGIAQDPEDRQSNQTLLRRARRSATAQLTHHVGRNSVGIDLLASGERPDIDAATGARVSNGGYALLNLHGSLAINDALSLGSRVENLLDKDYETASGYRQAGTTVFVSLRYAP